MENLNIPYNKYHNGKIYKVTDVAYTECYIGSTVQPLCNRMSEHRQDYKRFKTGVATDVCASCKLFDQYGVENCKIELIEAYPCENKEELRRREGYWIQQDSTCMNKYIAGRTIKEWRGENKCVLKQYSRVYRDANRDTLVENCRQYYKEHRDKLVDYKKRYYEDNKQHIRERRSKSNLCSICGVDYTNGHKARHEKTQRHLTALESNT